MQLVITQSRQAEAQALDRSSARGRGRYAIAVGQDQRLSRAENSAPARLIWSTPALGDPKLAVLGWLAGGMTGGDRLSGTVDLTDGARLSLISQAAEKMYRSSHEPAEINQDFTVADGCKLEYLPSESILFDGANLQRAQTVHADGSAEFVVGDMTVFGREAHGEAFTEGRLHDKWSVHIDGRLRLLENFQMDDSTRPQLTAPFGQAGRHYSGLIIARAANADAAVEQARALSSDACLVGASDVDGLIVIRLLAQGSIALRKAFAPIWSELRQSMGFSARLPRLWSV